MRKELFPLLFLTMTNMCLYGQETTVTTGGEITGSGGTVSYSIGQVLYTTNSSTVNSEAQGVQQPYEISIVLGMQKQEGIKLTCNVYPNPSTTFLVLEVENYSIKNLYYQLYDMSGKLLKNQRIESTKSTINMIDYLESAYLLQVVSESTTIQSFKVIKN